ncbi:DNA polymerase III, delta prime subunit [Beggiatoa sp. PS]|nr:DNA polymerase III, delta prime subunit [Beggiatoa sp. PS]
MTNVLPWHDALWQQIQSRVMQNRLPHALLLSGPQGMGKALFAQRLAENLLCEQPQADGQTCGHCKPCHLLLANTHPDLFKVEPVEAGKQISVNQIRELIQFSTLTASYNRHQIIIVNPAEAMNRNAANSLLKLLEEPSSDTVIMLVSHQYQALLATIRSRCQRIDFSHPEPTVTQTWLHNQLSTKINIQLLLNLSNQAPLAALALAQTDGMAKRQILFESLTQLPTGKDDPIRIAESWNQLEVVQVLEWMLLWTMDIIRYGITEQRHSIINQDHQQTLQRLAKQFNPLKLFELLDLQTEAYRLIMGSTNVKPQGLLESIAIAWVKLGTTQRRTI